MRADEWLEPPPKRRRRKSKLAAAPPATIEAVAWSEVLDEIGAPVDVLTEFVEVWARWGERSEGVAFGMRPGERRVFELGEVPAGVWFSVEVERTTRRQRSIVVTEVCIGKKILWVGSRLTNELRSRVAGELKITVNWPVLGMRVVRFQNGGRITHPTLGVGRIVRQWVTRDTYLAHFRGQPEGAVKLVTEPQLVEHRYLKIFKKTTKTHFLKTSR